MTNKRKCFGTRELDNKSMICIKCINYKECKIAQGKNYGGLKNL